MIYTRIYIMEYLLHKKIQNSNTHKKFKYFQIHFLYFFVLSISILFLSNCALKMMSLIATEALANDMQRR